MLRPCAAALLVVALLSGCQAAKQTASLDSHIREVERVRMDTVVMHDSVFVDRWTAGDTVYVTRDRWRTQYKVKLQTELRTDTIVKVETVTMEVTKHRSPWAVIIPWILVAALTFILVLIFKFR